MPTLFDPVRLGDLELSNRIVMAPLTRNRAVAGRVPSPLAVTYYAQRADAGLIVSEATQISPLGQGYLDTPGIYSREQIEGWRRGDRAVHAARRPDRGAAVARGPHLARLAAARKARCRWRRQRSGPAARPSRPRASRTCPRRARCALDELPGIVERLPPCGPACAMEAGFDGVEVHGANGYLLDQFLRDSSNHRSDAYGGSIENRARLLLEVMQAVTKEIGSGRTGLRLSPVTPANDIADSDPQPLFNYVVEQLAPMKLAFVHVIEGATGGPRDVLANGKPFDYAALRSAAPTGGAWIVNNGYDRQMALDAVASRRGRCGGLRATVHQQPRSRAPGCVGAHRWRRWTATRCTVGARRATSTTRRSPMPALPDQPTSRIPGRPEKMEGRDVVVGDSLSSTPTRPPPLDVNRSATWEEAPRPRVRTATRADAACAAAKEPVAAPRTLRSPERALACRPERRHAVGSDGVHS